MSNPCLLELHTLRALELCAITSEEQEFIGVYAGDSALTTARLPKMEARRWGLMFVFVQSL